MLSTTRTPSVMAADSTLGYVGGDVRGRRPLRFTAVRPAATLCSSVVLWGLRNLDLSPSDSPPSEGFGPVEICPRYPEAFAFWVPQVDLWRPSAVTSPPGA